MPLEQRRHLRGQSLLGLHRDRRLSQVHAEDFARQVGFGEERDDLVSKTILGGWGWGWVGVF